VDVVGVEVVVHERALLPEELHALVVPVGGAAADVDGHVAPVLEGELDEGRVDGLARLGGREGGREEREGGREGKGEGGEGGREGGKGMVMA
jgi:hypothetical protein